jgi:hypothetical protein
MSLKNNILYQAIAEAKSVGHEVVETDHLIIAIARTLSNQEFYPDDHEIVVASKNIHQKLESMNSSGFRPPTLSKDVEEALEAITDLESADQIARSLLDNAHDPQGSLSGKSGKSIAADSQTSFGDFHSIDGPHVARLPKFVTDRTAMIPYIKPFLIAGEGFIYDGAYNTRDGNISTRRDNAQSLGRMVVTNLRLIFWSDDFDKPHIGVFYNDITYWKTHWMPLKSRGVVMNTGHRKVLFAANSNAINHASTFLRNVSS